MWRMGSARQQPVIILRHRTKRRHWTKFQALSLDKEKGKEKAASISSYKDAIQVVKDGTTSGWGHIEIPTNNKNRTGVGFFPTSSKVIPGIEVVLPIQETFRSGGRLQPVQQTVNTICRPQFFIPLVREIRTDSSFVCEF